MSTTARRDALARLHAPTDGTPLLVVATGPFVGEGFDCPVLDTLFLAAPIAFKGRLVQYAGRIMRAHPGKTTAEVHDYHDVNTSVLASSLAKRAPGYVSLGFPDPADQHQPVEYAVTRRQAGASGKVTTRAAHLPADPPSSPPGDSPLLSQGVGTIE